jgi:glycosyltransferase involved in cell wall biosynthesis
MMDRARVTAPGIDESRWVLVRFAIELPEIPTRHRELNEPPVLLMASRFDPGKRHDLLIQATRRLLASGVEARIWLAGRGGQLEEAAKQLARRLSLERSICFKGAIPRPALLDHLASGDIDVVVLASDREGLSVSLIEALAYCVPAVASDVGGNGELLGDGCGELVPNDDVEALATTIARVLESSDLRQGMVKAGRVRVEREFAAEPVVRRLKQLFEFNDARNSGGLDMGEQSMRRGTRR